MKNKTTKNLILLPTVHYYCQICGREIKPDQGIWVWRKENGVVKFSGHLCMRCWKSGK